MKPFLRAVLLLCLPLALLAAPGAFFNGAVTSTAVLASVAPGGGQQRYLVGINASNAKSTTAETYIQFFDSATAGAVTPGTTPPLFVLTIPAGGVLDKDLVNKYAFNFGIVICATTTPSGSTAPSAAVPISLFYD